MDFVEVKKTLWVPISNNVGMEGHLYYTTIAYINNIPKSLISI